MNADQDWGINSDNSAWCSQYPVLRSRERGCQFCARAAARACDGDPRFSAGKSRPAGSMGTWRSRPCLASMIGGLNSRRA